MATYINLWKISEDSAFRQKVQAACGIAATNIVLEAPATANHAARLVWAKQALQNIERTGEDVLWAALATFAADSQAVINAKTDAEIQTAVNAIVTGLAV